MGLNPINADNKDAIRKENASLYMTIYPIKITFSIKGKEENAMRELTDYEMGQMGGEESYHMT